MRMAVLGSGSSGNCLVVESAGFRVAVDVGFSRRQILRRLAALGVDDLRFDALLLTHEHGDHVRGVNSLVKRHPAPIFATEGTLRKARLAEPAAAAASPIRSGGRFRVGAFEIEPFGVPHDAEEPVGFIIEDGGGHRLGVCFDLGCRSQLAWARLRHLDALVLETNHDLTLLRDGPYPWHLKQRVAGRHGHLSNREAAEGIDELVSDRLRSIVLYHLSRTNNHPTLAVQAVAEALDRRCSAAEVVVTSQDTPTPWIEIARQRSLF